MLTIRLLAISVAALFTSSTVAQQSNDDFAMEEEDLSMAYGDRNFVSIATGTKQSLRSAPSVTTVVTADDIAAIGASDLDEVLETVPGIHVSRASVRYASVYLIRGVGTGNQTNPQALLLQDGVPMTTMFNGDKGSAWRGTAIDHIARIEIIRGPGSALYGADAYAGVINIITKTAEHIPGTAITLRGGSQGTWDSSVQHGGKLGEVNVAGYLRVGQSQGYDGTILADAQTRSDRLAGTRASLAPGPLQTGYEAIDGNISLAYDNWRLGTQYQLRNNLETGAGINSALITGAKGRAEVLTGSLSWANPKLTEHIGAGFAANYLQYTFTYPDNAMLLPPGAKVGANTFQNGMIGGPNQWERQYRLSAFATYSGFAGHQLRVGLGHDDLNLFKTRTFKNFFLNAAGVAIPTGPVSDYSEIQPFIRPQQRIVKYAYLQDEWKFAKDWTLTAGLRHDSYSDFGGTTNPRLALVWDIRYDLTAKVMYGEAFRAPSFNEQYGINPVANGNPSLLPETIRTLEGAVTWQMSKDAVVSANVFRYSTKNIIRLLGTSYQNSGNQVGRGMELEAAWSLSPSLKLSGHYAYQRSENLLTEHDSGYAPRHHVYARADWKFMPGWTANAQVNHIADRNRPFGDPRDQIADATTLDLTLRTDRPKQGWDFSASLRNALNTPVFEPTLLGSALVNDLPMARRSFWFQGRYSL